MRKRVVICLLIQLTVMRLTKLYKSNNIAVDSGGIPRFIQNPDTLPVQKQIPYTQKEQPKLNRIPSSITMETPSLGSDLQHLFRKQSYGNGISLFCKQNGHCQQILLALLHGLKQIKLWIITSRIIFNYHDFPYIMQNKLAKIHRESQNMLTQIDHFGAQQMKNIKALPSVTAFITQISSQTKHVISLCEESRSLLKANPHNGKLTVYAKQLLGEAIKHRIGLTDQITKIILFAFRFMENYLDTLLEFGKEKITQGGNHIQIQQKLIRQMQINLNTLQLSLNGKNQKKQQKVFTLMKEQIEAVTRLATFDKKNFKIDYDTQ